MSVNKQLKRTSFETTPSHSSTWHRKQRFTICQLKPALPCFTAGDEKTWRVSTAISALPDRNTFVRLSKTSAAQIQTLKTQQLKNKPTATLKRRLRRFFVDDGRSHERNANRIRFNHCTVRFRLDQTGQDTGATQSATRSIGVRHIMS